MKKRLLLMLSAIVLICLFSIPVSAKSVTMNGKNVSYVSPNVNRQTFQYTYEKSNASYLGNKNGDRYGVVVPIKATSEGLLQIAVSCPYVKNSQNTYYTLYRDPQCKTEYTYNGKRSIYKSGSGYVYNIEKYSSSDRKVYLEKAGTYYLMIYSNCGKNEACAKKGSCSLRFVSSAEQRPAQNKWFTGYAAQGGNYIRVYSPGPGYITVNQGSKDRNNLLVYFCNSKKQAYKGADQYLVPVRNNCAATYKVNKGYYYVYFKNCADEEYTFKYSYTSSINAGINKVTTVTPAGNEGVYVRIKPSKTGYITVQSCNYGKWVTYSKMQFYNAKYQSISSESSLISNNKNISSNTVVLAVKKDQVYYVRVYGSDSSVCLKVWQTEVKEASHSTAKKATELKKGKTVQGIVLSEDTGADYYKVRVKKGDTTVLQFYQKMTSGAFQVSVYKDARCRKQDRYTSTTLYSRNSAATNLFVFQRKGSGYETLYIKVEKKGSKSTGSYSVKWNK